MAVATDRTQAAVQAYWDARPCDSDVSIRSRETRAYFEEVEQDRYRHQPHIADLIARFGWGDRNVLEIGTGVGTDARGLIARGARYTGINIDAGSCALTRRALEVFGVRGTVSQMSAVDLEFASSSFDAVYSFGVLHHIPDAGRAVREIHRVLKSRGDLVFMVYNRPSINYRVEILLVRRMAIALLAMPGALGLASLMGFPREKLARHVELHRSGASRSKAEWLARNTDGPDNPYSRVYDADEVRQLLAPGFDIVSQEVAYFEPRHWGPLGKLMPRTLVSFLGRRWGWHRIVHAVRV